MMKFAVLALLVSAAAASGLLDVSSQRALIHHRTPHGYGNGVSSRYFTKVLNRGYYGMNGLLGYNGGLNYGGLNYGRINYGGRAYDGIDNLGLAYNTYDLADGRLGLRAGRLGLGYGRLGYGLGGLGYLA